MDQGMRELPIRSKTFSRDKVGMCLTYFLNGGALFTSHGRHGTDEHVNEGRLEWDGERPLMLARGTSGLGDACLLCLCSFYGAAEAVREFLFAVALGVEIMRGHGYSFVCTKYFVQKQTQSEEQRYLADTLMKVGSL